MHCFWQSCSAATIKPAAPPAQPPTTPAAPAAAQAPLAPPAPLAATAPPASTSNLAAFKGVSPTALPLEAAALAPSPSATLGNSCPPWAASAFPPKHNVYWAAVALAEACFAPQWLRTHESGWLGYDS